MATDVGRYRPDAMRTRSASTRSRRRSSTPADTSPALGTGPQMLRVVLIGAHAAHGTRAARSRLIACVRIWETRDSVTPSTAPISFMVTSST